MARKDLEQAPAPAVPRFSAEVSYAPTPRTAPNASTDKWLSDQAPKPVAPSPPASVKTGQYETVLSALKEDFDLSSRSSAILAAHLFAECGDPPCQTEAGERTTMTREQIRAWASTLQKRAIPVWSAMLRCDTRAFVTFLGRFGIEHESYEDCERAVNRILKSAETPLTIFTGAHTAA